MKNAIRDICIKLNFLSISKKTFQAERANIIMSLEHKGKRTWYVWAQGR